jgi:hypothetical protein
MLLRMRALPPDTRVTAAGLLVVDETGGPRASKSRSRATHERSYEQVASPGEWLGGMGLAAADLVDIRDGELPGKDAGVRAWDLKFVSRLLLPENRQG